VPAINFDAERTDDDERFSAQEVFRTDRSKVVCGYFEPGQFIPLHTPASDVVVSVRAGTGIVRDGEHTHRVSPGDVVVVEAGTARGIRADEEERLEALLVTAPPPNDAEHEPVREGIQRGEFDPTTETTDGDGT
jgi:quercetin dioxygenase-like cupin family protein